MPPLRTLWKFYPDKKGSCTGFVLGAFGFSAMFFNLISEYIINPNNLGIEEITNFYPKTVGEKVPVYFLTTSIIILFIGLISICLLCEYPEDEEIKNQDLTMQELNVLFFN